MNVDDKDPLCLQKKPIKTKNKTKKKTKNLIQEKNNVYKSYPNSRNKNNQNNN